MSVTHRVWHEIDRVKNSRVTPAAAVTVLYRGNSYYIEAVASSVHCSIHSAPRSQGSSPQSCCTAAAALVVSRLNSPRAGKDDYYVRRRRTMCTQTVSAAVVCVMRAHGRRSIDMRTLYFSNLHGNSEEITIVNGGPM